MLLANSANAHGVATCAEQPKNIAANKMLVGESGVMDSIKRLWKRCGVLPLVLLAGVATAAPWDGLFEKKPAYPIQESGYWVHDNTGVFWINNHSILFVGDNDPKGERPDNGGKLSVWNLQDQTVRAISEYRSGLCFSQGWISYVVRMDKINVTHRVGEFGKEVEKTKAIESWTRDRSIRYNKLSCKQYPAADFPKGANIELREGHGYLGWKGGAGLPWPDNGEAPLRYYRDEKSPPLILPLKRKDIREPTYPQSSFYAEWADVYVLQGGAEWGGTSTYQDAPLPIDQPYPVYLFKPGSGKLTTLHAWYQKGVSNWQYFYTKAGLLAFSGRLVAGRIGYAGLYRVVGHGYEKMISGIPAVGAVSPDGCRLAFGMQYIDRKGYHGPIQLKVIDLCPGAK